jgi:hypothetical protein
MHRNNSGKMVEAAHQYVAGDRFALSQKPLYLPETDIEFEQFERASGER